MNLHCHALQVRVAAGATFGRSIRHKSDLCFISDPIVLHLGIYSTKMGILITKIHCGAVYSGKKEEIT